MSDAAHAWTQRLIQADALHAIEQRLNAQGKAVARGVHGSSTTLVTGALAVRMRRPFLLVVAHLDDADDALDDLQLFNRSGAGLAPPFKTNRFGALEVLPGESNVSLELLAERLAVVEHLTQPDLDVTHCPPLIVAPIQALMQSVPDPRTLAQFQRTVAVGDALPPAELFDWLDRAGYTRNDVIEQPGDFATRGGIIDLYLPSPGGIPNAVGPAAVRLDYFGDDIDAIHLINTDTMGSGDKVDRVQIVGASVDRIQSDDDTVNLIKLLPRDTIVVLNEVLELSEQARGYYERLTDARGIYGSDAVLKHLTQRPHVQVNQYSATAPNADVVELPVRPLPSFAQDAAEAVKEVAALADEQQVTVLCQQPAERERLQELLDEHAPGNNGALDLEVGYLHRGYVWDDSDRAQRVKSPSDQGGRSNQGSKPPSDQGQNSDDPSPPTSPLATRHSPLAIHLLPHHELFHRYHTRRRIRRVTSTMSGSPDAARDAFFDLEPGDYVVHVEHGVARFKGLKAMRRSGKQEDFLTLEFAGNALIHVPATRIDLVQKYVGGFEGKPPLSSIGGKRWKSQKEAVGEAVKELAAQMIQIQAARASLPGTRFPPDTAWQAEFEAEFPYDETEDQLAAIAAMKKSMADEQPMDRLICGDVGFGKTEVAIRGAFKAVEFGKQVAVLVPTTVLAEQHERTFRDRMADYPFRIESLSRFKTAKQQKAILKDVKEGKVDIVVGTHRLLSKDVHFADLGLVIIDEEQRFGVEHKQRLLQFRLTADVLTLSATPIPRTLHMAMLGLRDISSLSTAPLDRRAIVTEVAPYDEGRIKQAIHRELNRDGQVFFVHNRVHNIRSVANDIRRLVPKARIAVGHGQMPPRELEQVMLQFMRREVDILVSTTIIESGIDIPSANTMLINQADHFGLAELHQLRGRVGRYKHRAYCYLLLPQDRPITDVAARRLKAIEQYAMLGAGFKIAMRDLEIRGAGNLLGAEQSGHIAAVGYEMYCNMLEEAAHRLRDAGYVEPVRPHLELPIVGRIPANYIASAKHRMETYKRLSRAMTRNQVQAVANDLTDAYGDPPDATQALIDLTEIRVLAGALQVEGIKLEGSDLIFRARHVPTLEPLLRGAPGRTTLIDDRTVYWRPPSNYLEPPSTLLAVLRKLLTVPDDAPSPVSAATS